MLRLTYPGKGVNLIVPFNCFGYYVALPWTIPEMPLSDQLRWVKAHRYADPGSSEPGEILIEDENTIVTEPQFDGDCYCNQEAIEGSLSLDMSIKLMTQYLVPFKVQWQGGEAYSLGVGYVFIIPGVRYPKERNMILLGDFPSYVLYYTFRGKEYHYDIEFTPYVGGYHRRVKDSYNGRVYEDNISNTISSRWTSPGFTPEFYADRYRNMCGYIRRLYRLKYSGRINRNYHRWFASLDAVQGFHPYQLNLVEGLLQFSMEDIVPKGTSSSILELLTDAVNSKGGLLSPSGIVYGAQIFANCYLHYKYVIAGNVSDIESILVGDDKATMSKIVQSIHNIDPSYVPEQENWRLKRVAEIIVHRGHKLLSSYGTSSETLFTQLGEAHVMFRARLRAWPRYYDDMSTAAIVCEEFGLSLTAERLVAVVPYEFIAQWFLPIEENIRSIEYNRDRLQMLYKVHNLCLSEKVVIPLDISYLTALYDLSGASGSLSFKTYLRSSQREFPPTTLDLNLRPSISLSRVLQGSSLILSRI